MNCKSYQNLSVAEKIEFTGKILHLIQNDESVFILAKQWVRIGEKSGLFKNVKINPSYEENNTLTHTA
jgi:hypothetical protein